jgi:hydroxymethylpyrimidine pyrophosphatase-like HAD family hydrolase
MVDDSAFKIAIYHLKVLKKIFILLKHFEKYGLEVVVSGEFWMDIMNKNINKGKALSILQKN